MFRLYGVCLDWRKCVWIRASVFGLEGVCLNWKECVRIVGVCLD